MLAALRDRAENYWQGPGVAELTPWDMGDLNQGARACPRMTAVYDNNRCLMQLILSIDVFTVIAWCVMIVGFLSEPTAKLHAFAVNAIVLGGISVVCAIATIKAARAERMIIVVGSPDILGMHDDWPRLHEDAPQDAAAQPGDDAVNVTPTSDDGYSDNDADVRVFEFPNHEDILPGDQREAG